MMMKIHCLQASACEATRCWCGPRMPTVAIILALVLEKWRIVAVVVLSRLLVMWSRR